LPWLNDKALSLSITESPWFEVNFIESNASPFCFKTRLLWSRLFHVKIQKWNLVARQNWFSVCDVSKIDDCDGCSGAAAVGAAANKRAANDPKRFVFAFEGSVIYHWRNPRGEPPQATEILKI
jgi:hypothetical protein